MAFKFGIGGTLLHSDPHVYCSGGQCLDTTGGGGEKTCQGRKGILFWINMDVSKNRGTPKWIVKLRENPIKIDDLGVPVFLETPIFCMYFDDFFLVRPGPQDSSFRSS